MSGCPYCTEQRLLNYERSYSRGFPYDMDVKVQADPGVYADLCIEIDTEFLCRPYRANFEMPINYCPMCGRDLRVANGMSGCYSMDEIKRAAVKTWGDKIFKDSDEYNRVSEFATLLGSLHRRHSLMEGEDD